MSASGNHGGRRPGAGRKHGAKTIRTRIVAAQLAKREMTPLHVLISTMTELWTAAQATEGAPRLQLMRDACSVAEKAAPYLHPRLTSVNATVRKVTSIKDLSDEELLAIAASVGAGEGEVVVDEGSELVHQSVGATSVAETAIRAQGATPE